MIGTMVGNYRVVERIGDGGMGTVYRARDEMLDREVALKVMKPELSRQPALGERFRQEAIALARLNHPGIAAVYGLERSGDDLVMVMEFVRGETLEAVVQRTGRLGWARALDLCATVCEALDHAHDKGVVHRDIKPANIMLARDGALKVMDFGIARLIGKSRQTRVGAAVGTPMYMSPEQLRGEDVDGRSDLYSLGAVCYELITGRLAFEADSDYELMMKQLNEPPPPVRAAITDVPGAVDELLQRAMAKRREDRFPDASTMGAALRAAIGVPGTAPARRTPAETRLATPTPADRDVQLAGAGITADHPISSAGVAPTRLAASAPVADRALPAPTRIARNVGAPSRLADWRTWAVLAAVALVAALGARALRRPTEGGQVAPSLPGTSASAPALPSRDTATVVAGGADPLPSSPGAPRIVTSGEVARPVDGPISDEVMPAPSHPVTSTRAPSSPPVVARSEPPPASPAPVAERAEPTHPVVAEPSVKEPVEDAEDAIAEAIDAFTDAVNQGATARVGAVLHADGDTEKSWLDLMKEGRLTMAVGSDPDVSVSGGSATARFSATLSVRSAFGGNKRRTATFTADLARSGGTWRVTAIRPAGKVDLK